MSLLKEIEDSAVDGTTDISVLLRKCKVLAARLGSAELGDWVDRELNGYGNEAPLPDYRIIHTFSYGNFSDGFRKADRMPIPLPCLPAKFRDYASIMEAREPIKSYESTLRANAGDDFGSNWSPDVIMAVGSDIYTGMQCLGAWRSLSRGKLDALVDAVRNRVLVFVLGIQAEAPDAGEVASGGDRPIAEDRVTQIFNTTVYGTVGNVAVGSSHFSQESEVGVVKGDIGSLKAYLTSQGVSESDLAQLESALNEDGDIDEKGALGERVKAWIGDMVWKAQTGVGQVSASIAGGILANAIWAYYGFLT